MKLLVSRTEGIGRTKPAVTPRMTSSSDHPV